MSRYHRMNPKPYQIKYSQNFIKSNKLAEEVVKLTHTKKDDLVIEIGPGEGSLTEHLVSSGAKVIAVEKDMDLAENLKKIYAGENIEIVNQDFLDFQLPSKTYKLIGNIPFALTSRIIRKILEYPNPPEETFLILQKEAATRLNGNDLLSLKFKPWFKFEVIKTFRPEDFWPIPSVKPVFLKITKHEFPFVKYEDRENYVAFMTYIFFNSKNGLKTSLRKIFSFKQLGFISQQYNMRAKPSEIPFEKWLGLFEDYKKHVQEDKKKFVRESTKSIQNKQNPKKIYRSWVAAH